MVTSTKSVFLSFSFLGFGGGGLPGGAPLDVAVETVMNLREALRQWRSQIFWRLGRLIAMAAPTEIMNFKQS
jgi:hypothetical protein